MLKKKIQILITFLLFISPFLTKAEEIKNYQVNIEIKKDSSFLVEENIEYNFGGNYKHGIFRFIPVLFDVEGQEKWGGLVSRKLEIESLEVYRNGQKENIVELDEKTWKGNYYFKIGEKNKTLTGIQNYKIRYLVKGGLRYFNDYDEFYWNAIGLDWPLIIEKASVNLKSEDDFLNFREASCYYGILGSKNNCLIEKGGSGIKFFLNKNLYPNEGMTVAASFKKGVVPEIKKWAFNWKGIILLIFSSLFFIFYFIYLYVKRFLNEFNPGDPIIPIFKPYQNYHPAITGYLIDKKFDNRDLVAGFVTLAQRGYMDIKEIKDGGKTDYLFELKKDSPKDELDYYFLDFIFSNRDGEKIREIKLSDFAKKSQELLPKKQEISKWLSSYSEKEKLILKNKKNKIAVVLITVLLSVFAVVWFAPTASIILMILAIPLGILSTMMDRRYSIDGWKIKNNLEGFKLFLSMTEKKRMEFFNSPGTNPEEFFEYLPYAIAFGVEEKWQEQFKNIVLTPPSWYQGNMNKFNSATFVSNISKNTEVISHIAKSSSGSYGGGFSGGGSGGGGGSSW